MPTKNGKSWDLRWLSIYVLHIPSQFWTVPRHFFYVYFGLYFVFVTLVKSSVFVEIRSFEEYKFNVWILRCILCLWHVVNIFLEKHKSAAEMQSCRDQLTKAFRFFFSLSLAFTILRTIQSKIVLPQTTFRSLKQNIFNILYFMFQNRRWLSSGEPSQSLGISDTRQFICPSW